PEVLDTGKDVSTRVAEERAQLLVRHRAAEADGRPCHRLEARALRPVAEDHERRADPVRRLDRAVDPLVADEASPGQVVGAGTAFGREPVHVNRGIDDLRLPAVDPLDALRDEARVGDEDVDALRGLEILTAESLEDRTPEQRGRSAPVLLVE